MFPTDAGPSVPAWLLQRSPRRLSYVDASVEGVHCSGNPRDSVEHRRCGRRFETDVHQDSWGGADP